MKAKTPKQPRVQSPESTVQSPSAFAKATADKQSTVQIPKFRLYSLVSRVQKLESRMRMLQSKAQSPQSTVRSPQFGVQNPSAFAKAAADKRSKIQSATSKLAREIRRHMGFTLIELLVVISIIVVLAGMLFTAIPAVSRIKTTSRLKNEMAQIQTAIDAYKAKKGYYPPDNPGNPGTNQLYYELLGTRFTNDPSASPAGAYFYTLDGSARILASTMPAVFGAGSTVAGFMNCSRGSGDDLVRAENFFKGGLRSGQYFATNTTSTSIPPSALGSGVDGKVMIGGKVNPWRYNSSSPTNNPGTYDLWIDYDFGGQTNRICNWSDRALVVH